MKDIKTQIEKLYIDALYNDEAPNVFASKILSLLSVSDTITTKEGNLEIVKVYGKTERFFGKVLVKYEGFRTSMRLDKDYFNSIVEEKYKI